MSFHPCDQTGQGGVDDADVLGVADAVKREVVALGNTKGLEFLNHKGISTLTSAAVWNLKGLFALLLHLIPASIFGSIISMADMASKRPNMSSWRSSPKERSFVEDKKDSVMGTLINMGGLKM